MNWYNENDPYCAQWLKNLIAAGLIPAGDVDDRDVESVRAADLVGYAQCHFFAGLGGWSRALKLAGWPADRPVWTGSCPCQPFSHAGQRKGFDDKRHLWPAWFDLIRQCRPAIVLGEQVASAKLWLDAVCADLEGDGYAFGAAVLPAAGVGAPHQRDRWWFVACANEEHEHRGGDLGARGGAEFANGSRHASLADRQGQHAFPLHAEVGAAQELVADARREHGRSRWTEPGAYQSWENIHAQRRDTDVADAEDQRRQPRSRPGEAVRAWEPEAVEPEGCAALLHERGDVADAALDGWIERGTEPVVAWQAGWSAGNDWWSIEPDVGRVAHGIPARVAKLRALGNAIVPQVAEQFIRAVINVAP